MSSPRFRREQPAPISQTYPVTQQTTSKEHSMFDQISQSEEAALDFDALDELDSQRADSAREYLTGLPARPGTRR